MNENILITHPHLAHEWHYEKNSHINPEDFTANSRRFVWWICKSGHTWQDRISNRAKGMGCPYDSGKRWLFNFKSLAAAQPGIAAGWDYEKNDFLSPEDVHTGSHIRMWWRCGKGHSFKAAVSARIKGHGCPECDVTRRAKITGTPMDGGDNNA